MLKKLIEKYYWYKLSKLNLAIIPVQNTIDVLEAERERLFNRVVLAGRNPSSVIKNSLLLEYKSINARLDTYKAKRTFINYKISVYQTKIKGVRAQ